jgi:ribose transport system ATP-binding protein
MTVAENALLTTLPLWVSPGWEARTAQSSIDQLGIKTRGPHQPVHALSGGNQQKVALARLLAHDADVYLLDEPTRGIDVASKEQIYQLIDGVAQRGKAVLMVSSYLPELLGVCDRIAVMTRGRLGPALPVSQWSQEVLMHEAVGSA